MSRSTKQDILDTLLLLLQKQTLDEITVKELTERCGISRQAFYYHFSDIYAVVEWGLQLELQKVNLQEDWETILERTEDRFQEYRTVVLNIYRSFVRSYASHYLKGWIKPMMERKVRETAATYRVTEEQVSFVTDFFTVGFVDIILNWLDQGMPSRTNFDNFQTVISGSLDYVLERLAQKNNA